MNRVLIATTPAGPALRVVSLAGSEGLSEVFEFRVSFKSKSPDIDCQAMIGEACAITLETQNAGKRYLHGQMVRFAFTGRAGEDWTYEALVRPRLWHASRRSDCRIWQNLTVPDILQEVLGANGINYELRLKETYRPWEYLTQYRETDLNFISRLMEHEGIYYWFEHSEGNHLLVLGDHFSTHEPYPGYATVPWYPPDQTFVDQDHFYAWRQARETETGKYVHTDYDFKKPPTDLTTELADPKGHLYDQYEVFDFPGGYTDPGFGQHYAAVRLQALQADQDRVQGQGLVRGAAPGYRLTLDKHPRKDQNRELLIVRATYQIANNDYEGAGGSSQSNFEVAIEAMPAQTQFRPRRTTPKPHTLGPETAQVVGPSGEEIYTNEHGQVKVKFHWDRYGKKDGTDSCWIRVSHPWAGSNYGGIHIPRIGQEVIIDFLNGDPDYPIITGRVYNASQMPPWKLPANKTQSGFLTRSTKGGAPGEGMRAGMGDANALRFEDKKGDEQVWFHAQKDYLTEVEHDESKWVGNDRHKEIDRDETTEVHRHRTETVDGNETITIHMNRTETVDLNETITVHQNRTERVDLNEQISIGINRTEDVGANETISIGANRTENVGADETISIGSNRSVTIGANKAETVAIMKTETIGAAKMLTVGGLYQTTVGAAMGTSVVLSQTESVGKNKTVDVGDEYTIKAGKKFTVEVGQTIFVMNADGSIAITGKTINITAQGGDTTINGAKVWINPAGGAAAAQPSGGGSGGGA